MSTEHDDRTEACAAQALQEWADAEHAAHHSDLDPDAAAVLDLPGALRAALDAAHAAAAMHGIRLSTTIHLPWAMLGGDQMQKPWPDGTARSAHLIVGPHHLFACSPALPETGGES